MSKQLVKHPKNIEAIVESMTPKQANFLKLWLETGNGTRSAMAVYNTKDPKAASVIATENLAKLRNPMKLYLEYRGIGVNKLAKVLEDALLAEKTDITGDKHPDHKIRLEAGDRVGKWLGYEVKESEPLNPQVNIWQQINVDKYTT